MKKARKVRLVLLFAVFALFMASVAIPIGSGKYSTVHAEPIPPSHPDEDTGTGKAGGRILFCIPGLGCIWIDTW